MQNIDISEILKNGAQYQGTHGTVAGWVRTARDSKTMAFLALNDGTSLKHLQIVIDKTKFDQDALATVMKNGASVVAQGTVVAAMKEGEFEINADKIELLCGLSASKEISHDGVFAHHSAFASQNQYHERNAPRPLQAQLCNPSFLPRKRLHLRAHSNYHGQRLRGRG